MDDGRFLAFTGCLLTDSHGLSGQPAAAAWAGLRQAAGTTRMQTEYLAVPASATTAAPYLASLVVRQCGLVVAAGPAEVAAVEAGADRFAKVQFIAVGSATAGRNVSVAAGAAENIASQVAHMAVTALAKSG